MDPGRLLHLASAVPHWGALVLLYGLRPLVALSILPATADAMLALSVRTQLVLAWAVFAATGAYQAGLRAPLALDALLLLGVREGLIGFTLGFAAARVFWIAECVGALLDNMAGYNNIQLTNPLRSEQSTPLSDLMLQVVVVLFWSLGGMLVFFEALDQTQRWWPVLARAPNGLNWPQLPLQRGLDSFSDLMRDITAVSMPILFLLAAIDVVLGLLARAAKNIDTSAIGQPLKAAAALLALSLWAGLFAQGLQGQLALGALADWMRQWRSPP